MNTLDDWMDGLSIIQQKLLERTTEWHDTKGINLYIGFSEIREILIETRHRSRQDSQTALLYQEGNCCFVVQSLKQQMEENSGFLHLINVSGASFSHSVTTSANVYFTKEERTNLSLKIEV